MVLRMTAEFISRLPANIIASGRATGALGEALAQAEEQVKTLIADVASMAAASDTAFTPPPRAWIAERLKNLNELLAARTEKSALALRPPHRSRDAHSRKA